ncbi:hypothetical protein [Paracoccus sp. 08]|uniref:hypothetical protein n=1 Tax=Paracoccus sp. 08 TaxID=2606624 RepID=UPI002095D52A|nr:hypothetical protein [Paracoccus sp. 08]MCO6361587.1 hypothetical protein [Paracoccus sp. 08]
MSFPQNTPGIDELINLTAGEIAQLPVELLAAMQHEIDAAARHVKTLTARFATALEVRYAASAAEDRHGLGKDTGTVRLQDGPITVVAELPKRVDWDQSLLAALVGRILADGADPGEYVDLALSVSERKYTAWPRDIRDEFAPARTVRTGKPKFRLLLGEEVR